MRVRAMAKRIRATAPGMVQRGLLPSLSQAQKQKQPPISPMAARAYQKSVVMGDLRRVR